MPRRARVVGAGQTQWAPPAAGSRAQKSGARRRSAALRARAPISAPIGRRRARARVRATYRRRRARAGRRRPALVSCGPIERSGRCATYWRATYWARACHLAPLNHAHARANSISRKWRARANTGAQFAFLAAASKWAARARARPAGADRDQQASWERDRVAAVSGPAALLARTLDRIHINLARAPPGATCEWARPGGGPRAPAA